ncbi:MAG: TolC family protein [Bacteroidales bacterium]|nr:TolC family protein [Candidatus Colimorpha onthohippi]
MTSKMRQLITIICALLLLSGCGTYDHYEPYGTASWSDQTSIDSLPSWRTMFSDSCLVALIDTALTHNSDLQTAQLNSEIARETLRQAKWQQVPALGIQADGGNASVVGDAISTYSITGQASWQIDIFGQLRNARKAAAEQLLQSQAYQQAVQTNLIAAVATAYYSLLLAHEQQQILESTLHNWDETLQMMEVIRQGGTGVSEAELLQARANSMAIRSAMAANQRDLTLANNAICLLINQPVHHIYHGNLWQQATNDSVLSNIPLAWLSMRPDVRASEHALAQAYYITRQMHANFYPSIRLSGTAGWSNNFGGVLLDPAGFVASAVGGLVQPIINHGINRMQYRNARSRQAIAQQQFSHTLIKAGIEVNNTIAQRQAAQQMVDIETNREALMHQSVEKTILLMRHSSVSYLEVLTAQQQLLQTQKAKADAQYNKLTATVALYQALGGGVR